MIQRALALSLLLVLPLAAQQLPNQEAQEAVKRLKPPTGLKLTLVSAEPDFVNPVAFTIDEKGRFYVVETHRLGNCTYDIRGRREWVDEDLACRTVADREAMHRKHMGAKYETLTASERVRLLEDVDGDGRVDRAVTFAENFATPADGLASGVIARRGDVWFANIPNLWKLRDTNGDNIADVRTVLHTGYGVRLAFIGHDLHGLTWGPDGRLYFTIGDRGVHVEKDGKVLVDNPDSGCVLRCDPDGANLEVFSTGLRNPQELAFDDCGNLFTVDNNCDNGDRARFSYLMEGGDCGWRIGYQQAPRAGPWMSERLWELDARKTSPSQIPPIAHIGHGPSGLVWNGGLGLPDKYAGRFFLANFPGEVLSWSATPDGAGFAAKGVETFLGDNWATDVEVGVDGALYILDWVRGWGMPQKGRIFRVADPSLEAKPQLLQAKKLLAAGLDKQGDDVLLGLLAHGDRRLRQEAQFELAARGADFSRALAADRPRMARIHAVWGCGQRRLSVPLIPLLNDADAEIRAQAARVLGDLRQGGAALIPLLKDESPRVRSLAALALGRIGHQAAATAVVDMIRENADRDPWLRHAGVMALARCGDPASLLKDPSPAVRLSAVVALRRQRSETVAAFLDDADPAVAFEAARAIYDEPVAGAMKVLAGKLAGTLPEKAVSRAVNAAYKIGDASALASYASRKDVGESLRIEAIRALGEWGNPPGRDRILHLWRPIPARDATDARRVFPVALLEDPSEGVSEVAAEAAGRLGLKEAAPTLVKLASKPSPPKARVKALQALALLKDERLTALVLAAAEDPDANLRKEAVKLFRTLDSPDVPAMLEKLALEEGAVAVRQAAIASLGHSGLGESEAALGRLLDRLLANTLPAALRLDVLEAAGRKPSLKDKLARAGSALKADDPLAAWRDVLEGGDAEEGRKVFFDRTDASCLKCHKVKGKGGDVGPDLGQVSKDRTREYLMESLAKPNAQIAKGYEQVILLLKNDLIETGRVEKESASELALILSDGSRKKVRIEDIKGRKTGLSAMPEDSLKTLSKRDVRNLLEYLYTLR